MSLFLLAPSKPARQDEWLFAVLSDIHGNYAALQAVERDAAGIAAAEGLPAPRYICLGDYVDYGPQPNECMRWLEQNAERVALLLRGNHDAEMAEADDWRRPQRVGERWWPITLWTRLHLEPRYRRQLAVLPEAADGPPGLEDFICFHSTPWNGRHSAFDPAPWPQDGYIDDNVPALEVLRALGATHVCGLFGHTHYQVMHVRKNGKEMETLFAQPEQCELRERDRAVNTWHQFPSTRSAIVNPGSVGQPRQHSDQRGVELGDHDLRAGYLLLHRSHRRGETTTRFQWRRVAYDSEQTAVLLARLAWRKRLLPNQEETGRREATGRLPAAPKTAKAAPALQDRLQPIDVQKLAAALPSVTAELVRALGRNVEKPAA